MPASLVISPWIQTLISSLSGVFVGFGLTSGLSYWKEKRELKNLALLLGAEIAFETIKAKESVKTLAELRKQVVEGDAKIRGHNLRKDPHSVYAANLNKIAEFPTEVSIQLRAFDDFRAGCAAQSELLSDHFDAFHSQKMSRNDVIARIDEFQRDLDGLIQIGNSVIESIQQHYPVSNPQVFLQEIAPGDVVIAMKQKAATSEE